MCVQQGCASMPRDIHAVVILADLLAVFSQSSPSRNAGSITKALLMFSANSTFGMRFFPVQAASLGCKATSLGRGRWRMRDSARWTTPRLQSKSTRAPWHSCRYTGCLVHSRSLVAVDKSKLTHKCTNHRLSLSSTGCRKKRCVW
jgi:hypothetical protein